MDFIAATMLEDVLKPKAQGEPVNVHVVEFVAEPRPDFSAMQRIIESKDDKPQLPNRESEK
jgi:hypothetical protein